MSAAGPLWAPGAPRLVPWPASCVPAGDVVRLGAGGGLRIAGAASPALTAAAERFAGWFREHTGLSFGVGPAPGWQLRLQVDAADDGWPALGGDESYHLTVEEAGVTITAPRVAGARHGLTTLRQLIRDGLCGLQVGARTSVALPGVRIADRPRFPWRGLLVDTSRHFIPVPVLRRILDQMEWARLNVLHLHLTDDQGFRIESRAWPELHRRGSEGAFYSRDEVRTIVDHAAARGIRVVPEFDLPGHASSWLVGYPRLGCRPGDRYALADTFGHHDVCLDPTSEAVYEFLAAFFADVLPLFPDRFVHLGGDEVAGGEWLATPHIREFMAAHGIADARQLQARFNARLHRILAVLGKTLVGWDEVVHPDLPADVVVQSWRGPGSVAAITAAGHPCLRSHGYYLNLLHPVAEHYLVDPVPDDLPAAQAGAVLGGEACMWTERADGATIESRLWPRALAIAERFWSPREVRDLASLRSRLFYQAGRPADRDRGAAPRQLLVDLLIPVPLDESAPGAGGDRRAPLDRLADRLPVESFQVENFRHYLSESLLGDIAAACARLRDDPELGPLAERGARLAAIGLAALESTGARPADWLRARQAELDTCAEPHDGVRLGIVPVIRELVRAAAGGDR